MLALERATTVWTTLRKRGRRRRTAAELIAETENGVADLDCTVAVTIRRFLTGAGRAVVEELVEDPNCIPDVHLPVVVGVTAKKRLRHDRRAIDVLFDEP